MDSCFNLIRLCQRRVTNMMVRWFPQGRHKKQNVVLIGDVTMINPRAIHFFTPIFYLFPFL